MTVFANVTPLNLHISLIDIALFTTLIILVTFCSLLWFAKKATRAANKFLAIATGCLCFSIAHTFNKNIPLQPVLVFGPFIFFYIRRLINPGDRFRKNDLSHFLLLLLPFIRFVPCVALLITGFYLYRSYRVIFRYNQQIKYMGGDRYRQEWQWLAKMIKALALLLLISVPLFWLGYAEFAILGFAMALVWLAATAHLRSSQETGAENDALQKSILEKETKQKTGWLKTAMQTGRYHQNPDLSIHLLASQLNLTVRELSQIINTGYDKNFNDFINEYRVAEVIVKMQDPANDHLTLQGIAYDAGFNSRSTFNRVFKEISGKSPADYKAGLKKEYPNRDLGQISRPSAIISRHQSVPDWSYGKLNRLTMFKNALKIAWRGFLKDRRFTLLNLVGLSTGLACTLLIYLWVNDELQVDRFHQHNSRLYQVMVNQKSNNGIQTLAATNVQLARALKADMPEVEDAAAALPPGWTGKVTLSDKDNNLNAQGQFVDPDYLKLFTYPLIEGDPTKALNDKNSIIISRSLALKLFHTADNLVGKTISWQHQEPYLISGVMEDVPKNSSVQFDFLVSMEKFIDQHPFERTWGNSDPNTYLLLRKGTDMNAFNQKISAFLKTRLPNAEETLFIRPYADGYLYGNYENGIPSGGRITYVKLFSIIALFILVIACINFMNLSTAKATKRLKEVGVKKAIGASRKSLVFQYLGESMLMTVVSIILGIGIVLLVLPQFNQLTGKEINFSINGNLLEAILAITIITGFIAGSYPALYLSGFNPAVVLKGKIKTGVAEVLIRKGLVVFQFTLSVVFIIGVVVVYQQIQYIQTKSLGFDKDHVIAFDLSGVPATTGKVFLNEVKNLPGVINASGMDHNSLINDFGSSSPVYDGKAPNSRVSFGNIGFGYDMFETLGLHLASGRSFSRTLSSDTLEAIVNEAAVKAMGIKDPIGKHINVFGDGKRTIVGVVKDFHFQSMHEAVKPFVLRLVTNNNEASEIMIRVKSGSEHQMIARLQDLFSRYHSGYPFEYRFLDADYQQQYDSENRVSALSRYFGGLAILISCLGLFGLAAFTAERRIKEIGVRRVLGASVKSVVVLLSKDFLKLIGIALLIAFPIAWFAMSQWLNSFAYRISIGPGVFIAAGILMAVITLLTISSQMIKAALANPVKSLRSE